MSKIANITVVQCRYSVWMWKVLPFEYCRDLFCSLRQEGAVKRAHHQVGHNVMAVRKVLVVSMRRRQS